MKAKFRGLSSKQEVLSSESVRDIRPITTRAKDFLSSRTGAALTLVFLSCVMFVLPVISDVIFLLIIIIFWYAFFDLPALPFKLPVYAKYVDKNHLSPANKPQKASGIYYFGNELNTKDQLWFNNEDMRTHVLVFGSTGSGKTETLLSLAYNALNQGSGFIYVDGKGDNLLYSKVFSMAESLGRQDDLLVLNYMTGAQDIIGHQKTPLSNTMNPFAIGSSSMLSQLIVSLLGGSKDSGDGDMWKGRAISFVEALMRLLVYLRDEGLLRLDAGVIRKYFVLDVLESLVFDQVIVDAENNTTEIDVQFPFSVVDPLMNYLSTLPGYQNANKGKQSDKAYEQHGYITMQLTRVFGSLADVYAHIMKADIAEIDFNDVILNRRILVVLLPALEKSPDELSNLGKLIVASLKAMLASGLGSKVHGEYKDVIETKPTNAKHPYLCILDEYGYYAVPGFAVVPAQARSLGFSAVFAGQDLPAFQKASKEEAASICANTNIKICMKLEDPTETWEFFQKNAGEAYTSVAKSYQVSPESVSMRYLDAKEAGIEKRARIDLMDLKDQKPGEFHIFFKSQIVRGKSFYANPPKTKYIHVNQFIRVKPIDVKLTKTLKAMVSFSAELPQDRLLPANLHQLINDQNKDKKIQVITDKTALSDHYYRYVEKALDEPQDKEAHQLIEMDEGDSGALESNVQEHVIDAQFGTKLIYSKIPLAEKMASEYFDFDCIDFDDYLISAEMLSSTFKKFGLSHGLSLDEIKKYKQALIELVGQTETGCYQQKTSNEDIQTILDKAQLVFNADESEEEVS
ncbi:type IV secretory system conjugative DNA transfer family protein [Facilibium subflavum]|uniref:type IV secretory system conjugative DNA transfer family protein n=1 Tax=Facilibium subflavum TaxID=2219058 RepID=UPI000E659F8C|nr:TraM recognition domain-containing protein [Facilibium subflavum]